MKYMHKTEGWYGFFKGNGATVVKIAPFSAAEFYFYEVFKVTLYPTKSAKELTYFNKLICGGLCGMVSSTLTYPFDLVKTYLTINTKTGKIMNMN